MVALQNHYNLAHREEYEGDLAHVAESQGLGVMPRFALASGFLTAKYRHTSPHTLTERGRALMRKLGRRGQRILATLDSVAEAHGTSMPTIALAWLLTKPNVVAPVVAASRADQIPDLTAAARVQLGRHQVAELDRVSRV
jgi:aryl-alcohol dehydrogenase-like predicted oxidoreductase